MRVFLIAAADLLSPTNTKEIQDVDKLFTLQKSRMRKQLGKSA